jgi:hypothetical protein
MPLIQVKLIDEVFTWAQGKKMISVSTIKNRLWIAAERRRSHCPLAAVLPCLALAVQAFAGASPSPFNETPAIGILPFAGDVFTSSSNGTLIAVDPSYTPASAPLFNLAGNSLGVTWGQFSSGTAKSVAWAETYKGTTYTQFLVGMSGLVPNGVYSLFYRTFSPNSNNPVCPNAEPAVALTAAFPEFQKPDPDSFVANASGEALFFASVPEPLLDAQGLQVVVIYHFDGKTYGPVPNFGEAKNSCRSSYGDDAMRQFLIIYK